MDAIMGLVNMMVHTLPKAPKGLNKYEVLVVGKSLSATFTKRFGAKTHGHHQVMHVSRGGKCEMAGVSRQMYEKTLKVEYYKNTTDAQCESVASSDGSGVTSPIH